MSNCEQGKISLDSNKQYLCTWGAFYCERRVEVFPGSVFKEKTGYSAAECEAIAGLNSGESYWASGPDIVVMRLPDFATDLDQSYRYAVPVQSELITFLPKTDLRPEAMRVTKRIAPTDTWFEVETYSETLNRWIDQKQHAGKKAAVNDATGWYPAPTIEHKKVVQNDPLELERVPVERKVHEFRFKIALPKTHPLNGGAVDSGNRFVTLTLTQEQFEDQQGLKERVYHVLEGIGISRDDKPYWKECPDVQAGFEERLRQVIGADKDAQFTARYPHSWHHQHYKEAVVDGVPIMYQSFSHDQFIKWAPSMSVVDIDMKQLTASAAPSQEVIRDDSPSPGM